MGGSHTSSKAKMVQDPTLTPERQALGSFFTGATKGGTQGLSLPQYQGPYGTGDTPLYKAATNSAMEAINAPADVSLEDPTKSAIKDILGLSQGADSRLLEATRTRGLQDIEQQAAATREGYSAMGGRFSTPAVDAEMRGRAMGTAELNKNIGQLGLQAQGVAAGAIPGATGYQEFLNNNPITRALAAFQAAKAGAEPQDTIMQRKMAEFARTQAALLPFAIQFAGSFPPVATTTSRAGGGILVS